MIVKDVMKSVESVPEDATIAEAARVMKDNKVGLVPVKDEHDLSGVVTRREIALIAAEEGGKVRKTRVDEVLRPCIVFCQDTDSGEDALAIMINHGVTRLVVRNESGNISGVVEMGDVLSALAKKSNAKHASKNASPGN